MVKVAEYCIEIYAPERTDVTLVDECLRWIHGFMPRVAATVESFLPYMSGMNVVVVERKEPSMRP
jgi:hypothetical protein